MNAPSVPGVEQARRRPRVSRGNQDFFWDPIEVLNSHRSFADDFEPVPIVAATKRQAEESYCAVVVARLFQ